MAHQVETMVSVREVPWHKLGKIVQNNLTAEEAIIDGGMNWECIEQPLFLSGHNEVDGIKVIGQRAPSHKAVVRDTDNSILGVVGNGYHIIQNRDCFSFLDDTIGSGQAVYETAGSLKSGKVIFMTVKLPNDAKVGDDVVEKYILLTSSHDGSMSLQVRWTPIRVVCMNTLNAALHGRTDSTHKIRHTKNYREKVAQVREVLNLTDNYYSVMETEWNRLLDTPFSTAEMQTLAEKLTPVKNKVHTKTQNKRDKILELFHTGRGQTAVANTRWAAFNAVTEYADYFASTRKIGDTSESEARMNSTLLGGGKDLKQRAFDLLKVDPKIQETVLV